MQSTMPSPVRQRTGRCCRLSLRFPPLDVRKIVQHISEVRDTTKSVVRIVETVRSQIPTASTHLSYAQVVTKKTARYRVRTCDPYRVKVVLYH